MKDKYVERCVYDSFGKVYCNFGNVEKVLGYYEFYFKIVKELEDEDGEKCLYSDFGDVYFKFGDLKNVVYYYEFCLKSVNEG